MREYGPDKFFLYELQRDVPWESLDDAQNAWMDKLNPLDDGYNRKRAGSLIGELCSFKECDAWLNLGRGSTRYYYDRRDVRSRRTDIRKRNITLYFPDPV